MFLKGLIALIVVNVEYYIDGCGLPVKPNKVVKEVVSKREKEKGKDENKNEKRG